VGRHAKKEKRMKIRCAVIFGLGLLFSTLAMAADFDGSVPLACLGLAGHNCTPDKAQCSKVKPETNIKPEVTIDLANKTVKSPFRTDLLPIGNSVLNDEQLELQGTSEKFAWSAIVNRKTGKMTLTIADRIGAYVIFGQCKVSGS
jgi:hypothetical protein